MPYRFAKGEMALVAGDGGGGKSLLLLAAGAVISRGGEWWDHSGHAPLGSVIIVSAEDSKETTLKPRLLAMGADLSRIKFLTAKVTIQRPGERPLVHPKSFQDLDYWTEVFRRTSELRFLMVDPIPSYLGRGVRDDKNIELRQVLEPFIETVLRPSGVCMGGVTHLNKNIDAKTPIHRITGSMAYGNLPRNVHFVVDNPDKPGQRLFKQAKCNNAPRDLPAIAFEIMTSTIPSPRGEIETIYPSFAADTVSVDLREALVGGKGAGRPGISAARLAEFLFDFLKGKGPVLLGEIASAAGAADLIGKQREGKNGRIEWTGFTNLYRAVDGVASLPTPRNGWIVATSKEDPTLKDTQGRARWLLRKADSPY
jgi:hypothetical protein